MDTFNTAAAAIGYLFFMFFILWVAYEANHYRTDKKNEEKLRDEIAACKAVSEGRMTEEEFHRRF